MIDNKEASKIISQNEIEIANKFKEKDYGAVQSGPMMLFVYGFLYLGVIIAIAVTCFVLSSSNGSFPFSQEMFIAIGTPVLVVGIIIFFILCSGFIVVGPNEAIVFQLFGKYKGTFKKNG
jgi:hypothetical protein